MKIALLYYNARLAVSGSPPQPSGIALQVETGTKMEEVKAFVKKSTREAKESLRTESEDAVLEAVMDDLRKDMGGKVLIIRDYEIINLGDLTFI